MGSPGPSLVRRRSTPAAGAGRDQAADQGVPLGRRGARRRQRVPAGSDPGAGPRDDEEQTVEVALEAVATGVPDVDRAEQCSEERYLVQDLSTGLPGR